MDHNILFYIYICWWQKLVRIIRIRCKTNVILYFLHFPYTVTFVHLSMLWLTFQTTLMLSSHWIFVSLCDFYTLIMTALSLQPVYLFVHVHAAELGLNAEVTQLVNECERPSLVQSLLLPEDLALRHLPALGVAHRRLDFTHRNSSLSPLQEVWTAPSYWVIPSEMHLSLSTWDACCTAGFTWKYVMVTSKSSWLNLW